MPIENASVRRAPDLPEVEVIHAFRAPARKPSRWVESLAEIAWAGAVIAGVASLEAPMGASMLLTVVCASMLPMVFELRHTKRQLAAVVSMVRHSQGEDR